MLATRLPFDLAAVKTRQQATMVPFLVGVPFFIAARGKMVQSNHTEL
jgi:hypothetical protein